MVSVKLLFLCIFYLVLEAQCEKVEFIDPCRPDDNPCILKSAQKAMPVVVGGVQKLGLASSDPLVIGTVVCDANELKLTFKELVFKGAKNCIIVNAERNLKKSEVILELNCPFDAQGKYVVDGKILSIDVVGNGDSYIKSDQVKLFVAVKIKTVDGSDGQKHWQASRHKVKVEPVKKVEIDLKNLFNGDEEKAKPVLTVINASSDDLVKIFGKCVLEQLVDHLLRSLNDSLLAKLSVSDLELA